MCALNSGFDERKAPRRPSLETVACQFGEQSFKGQLLDVSERGVFVECEQQLPKGSQVFLDFALPFPEINLRLQFKLRGIVARAVDEPASVPGFYPQGFGVCFFELSPKEHQALKHFSNPGK